MIIESLYEWTRQHPGLALRANTFLTDSGSDGPPAYDVDADLLAFIGTNCPLRVEPDDLRRHLEALAAETRALAARLADLGPVDSVARFTYLAAEARLAGHEWVGANVAGLMAPHLTEPVEWYLRARDAGLSDLMQTALAESLSTADADLPPDILHAELRKPDRRPIVITSALSSSTLNNTVAFVVDSLQADDAPLLTYGRFRDTADDVLYRLLTHPVPEIAAATSIQFDPVDGRHRSLPDSWRTAWRNAFLNSRGDSQTENDWRINNILEQLVTHDPDLATEWFERRLSGFAEAHYLQQLKPRDCEQHLPALPTHLRERLTRQYLALDRPRIGNSLLTHVLGRDATLAETLLNEGTLSTQQLLEAIAGVEDAVDQLGPLLLQQGVAAEAIADAARPRPEFAFGDDIQDAHQNLDYYRSLAQRVPALAHVSEIGIATEEKRLLASEKRQRQARLRGEYS